MSDWQVGDLAVCIDASKNDFDTRENPDLEQGRTYQVERVGEVCEYFCLGLAGMRDPADDRHFAYRADRFRKPDKHEACEDEFAILLKLSKQRVGA